MFLGGRDQGDRYERGGGGQDSRTGEWSIIIGGGASKIYYRVKTENGEKPSA